MELNTFRRSTVQTSIYIPRELHKPFSGLMVVRGKSMNEYLVDFIRREVEAARASPPMDSSAFASPEAVPQN